MDLNAIKEFQDSENQKKKEQASSQEAKDNAQAVAAAVKTSSFLNSKASKEVKSAVAASGDKVAAEVDKVRSAFENSQDAIAQSLNNLMLATVVTKDPRLAEAADNVAKLLASIADASERFDKSNLNLLPVANKELASSISALSKAVGDKQEEDLTPQFDRVVEALNSISVSPVVNVAEKEVSVDLDPVISAIKDLQKSIKPTKIDIPKTDFTDVLNGLGAVKQSIADLSFPVPNYVLPFQYDGKATQANLDSSGNVIVTEAKSSSATVTSVASSATNVSILAANSGRKGATFFNDTDKSCYLKFGTTASTSSFTIRIFSNGFFSLPYPAYTGAIDAIWEAAPTGSLRITEF